MFGDTIYGSKYYGALQKHRTRHVVYYISKHSHVKVLLTSTLLWFSGSCTHGQQHPTGREEKRTGKGLTQTEAHGVSELGVLVGAVLRRSGLVVEHGQSLERARTEHCLTIQFF